MNETSINYFTKVAYGLTIICILCLTLSYNIIHIESSEDISHSGYAIQHKNILDYKVEPKEVQESRTIATYTSLGVPNINSSFKTWMDYRTVTNTESDQYKLIKTYGWCDDYGFIRATGERDLGIDDDYYIIALGSYYGTEIGTKYRITTDTGNVFYGVLGDLKDDRHTNSTHQYAGNNDVVEFIVDTRYLHKDVKKMGSAGVFEPLKGNISSIEKIEFIEE